MIAATYDIIQYNIGNLIKKTKLKLKQRLNDVRRLIFLKTLEVERLEQVSEEPMACSFALTCMQLAGGGGG